MQGLVRLLARRAPHVYRKPTAVSISLCLILPLLGLHSRGVARAYQLRQTGPGVEGALTLEPGAAIEREMAGGDTHAYRIKVTTGDYVHVVVDQRGIDVVVRLLAPDGRLLIEIDSPNGMYGPEPISLVAEQAGYYRLEVLSYDRKAVAGRYEARLLELRTATEQDRIRVAAERAYFEGQQLSEQGTEAARRQSIAKYLEALPIWRALRDRQGEADTLYALGYVYDLLAEERRALDFYTQALRLYESLSDDRSEAKTLSSMGAIYDIIGEKQKALEHLNRALALRRKVADRVGEAYTLNNIGEYVNGLGEPQQAVGDYEQSLAIFRATGERKGAAYAIRDLGRIYNSLGETKSSIYYFRQALTLSREVGDRQLEASCLLNLGLALNSSGDTDQALDSLKQALTLQRTIGDHNGEAHTLDYLGTIYDNDGRDDRQKALQYYAEALRLSRDPEVADRGGEAQALYNLGRVYSKLGGHRRQQAYGYFSQSLDLFRQIKNGRGAAFSLRGMAGVERDRGQLDAALTHVEAAVALIETLRGRIVGPDWRASFMSSARELYELNVDVLMRLYRARPHDGYLSKALEVSERARARGLLELLAEQRTDIRQGISPSLLERARSLEQTLKDKAEYQMRLLSGKNTPEEVAAVDAELTRLNAEYQEVEARIRAASPRYAGLAQPHLQSITSIQKELLGDDNLLLEFFVGEERSYLWLVSGGTLTGFTLPGRAEVEASAAKVISLLAEHGTKEEFETKAADFSRMLLGQAASQLGRKRLVIVPDGALEYVPFAALPAPASRGRAYVPLINEHEVVNLPSAAVLATLREQLAQRTPAPKEMAILADPVFTAGDERVGRAGGVRKEALEKTPAERAERSGPADDVRPLSVRPLDRLVRSGVSLERLSGTRREAELILALVPKGSALAAFDFDANLDTALSPQMRDYKIIHFATHGFFNPTRPELSGLILSLVDKNGAERNGFLSIPQVFGMSLAAELVVLSGCQTGKGKQIKGEGLIALTRAFMYAGSPRVVSTLWQVSDDATAELMGRFYRAMLGQGLRPGAALRAAQLSMMADARWNSPHHWAGFILSGEWR